MTTFLLAFLLLTLVMLGMSLGVMFTGKRIKGSCGGLGVVPGTDKCVICKQKFDPDIPPEERVECPRSRNRRAQ